MHPTLTALYVTERHADLARLARGRRAWKRPTRRAHAR